MFATVKGLLAIAWLVTIAVVLRGWMDFEHSPGRNVRPQAQWPVSTQLRLDRDHGTLVVFLHPFCPCSRATLERLEQVLSDSSKKPTCCFMIAPVASSVEIDARSANLRLAKAMSPSRTFIDGNKSEARLFDPTTSGHVFYYDAGGSLRFSGGVLVERGSNQPNTFAEALYRAINNPTYPVVHTPVFGCSLVGASIERP